MVDKRIIPAFGVIFLFLFSALALISFGYNVNISDIKEQSSYHGNILYVGASGEANYTKIQDAIDDAFYGDTVFVYDDSSPYYENIWVNKSISLIGEDKNTTTIDGGGITDVIFINSNWINISGFTIQNGGFLMWNAGIFIDSLYSTISGNIIINNRNGIILIVGAYNNITNNIIKNNWWDGIRLSCDSNTIIGNTISNNNISIELVYSDNNTIYHNNLIKNYQNAYDEWTNIWNNSYPSGCNYWDDYNGIDDNGDGIGDTLYFVPSGYNQDNYPLMFPSGNQPPNTPTITGPTSGKPGKKYISS